MYNVDCFWIVKLELLVSGKPGHLKSFHSLDITVFNDCRKLQRNVLKCHAC